MLSISHSRIFHSYDGNQCYEWRKQRSTTRQPSTSCSTQTNHLWCRNISLTFILFHSHMTKISAMSTVEGLNTLVLRSASATAQCDGGQMFYTGRHSFMLIQCQWVPYPPPCRTGGKIPTDPPIPRITQVNLQLSQKFTFQRVWTTRLNLSDPCHQGIRHGEEILNRATSPKSVFQLDICSLRCSRFLHRGV